MTTRIQSLRDQIATVIQTGHITHATSDEVAVSVLDLVAAKLAEKDETIELMALGTCRDTP
jgi:hypothetical protein